MKPVNASVSACLATAAMIGTLNMHAQPAGTRAFVLDPEARNVKVLDVSTGAIQATVPLEGERPERMWLTPDGTRIAVVHAVPGKPQKAGLTYRGWLPSSHTMISLIDTASAKVAGKAELGWNWGDAALLAGRVNSRLALFGFRPVPSSSARHFTVLCPGVSSKKSDEQRPAELITVDWTEGNVVGRVEVDSIARLQNRGMAYIGELGPYLWGLSDVLLRAEGGQLTLLSPGRNAKSADERVYPELLTVEPVPGRLLGRIRFDRFDGHLLAQPQGRMAVSMLPPLLPNAGARMPGELRFLDLAGPTVLGTLALDGTPVHGAFSLDRSVLYVLEGEGSEPAAVGPPSRVLAVTMAERRIRATTDSAVKLGRRPHLLRLTPDGSRLLVVADDVVTMLDAASLTAVGSVPSGAGRGSNLIVAPDGRRGFLSYSESDEMAILDLEKFVLLGSVKAPGTSKAAQIAGAIMNWPALLGWELAFAIGGMVPSNVFVSLDEPAQPPSDLRLSLGPDGRWVYAHNPETGKTAIVNVETGKLLGVFRGRFRFLAGGEILGEYRGVTFIDPVSGRESGKLALAYEDLQVTSDERYAAALTWNNWSGKGRVTLIDLSARKVTGEVTAFKDATQIVLVEAPTARTR
jgi:DNA-binding beta-propeller fold protein YncE